MAKKTKLVVDAPRTLNKIVVVAGSHKQFQYWLWENHVNPKDALYVSAEWVLCGIRLEPWQVVYYGTYAEREDWYQIEARLKFGCFR